MILKCIICFKISHNCFSNFIRNIIKITYGYKSAYENAKVTLNTDVVPVIFVIRNFNHPVYFNTFSQILTVNK